MPGGTVANATSAKCSARFETNFNLGLRALLHRTKVGSRPPAMKKAPLAWDTFHGVPGGTAASPSPFRSCAEIAKRISSMSSLHRTHFVCLNLYQDSTKENTPTHVEVFSLEGPVGLEPTTPCLKGRCSNRLSYGPVIRQVCDFFNARSV